MRIANVIPFVLAATFSCSHADTEFQGSVPLDLVKAFLGSGPAGEIKIYSDLLDGFPSFQLPAGFSVFGSIDRGYSLSAVLATDLPETEALAAIQDAFSAAGYSEFEVPGMRNTGTGFVRPNQPRPQQGTRLCHDTQGFVSYSYMAENNRNLLIVSSSYPSDSRTCAQQFEEQAIAMSRSMDRMGGVRQYIPRMEMPEETSRRMTPFFGMGSSGSGSDIESRASLRSDWDIDAVFRHFKVQIEEQGWELDSENVGSATATGNWTRSPEPDMDLVGTLTIIKSNTDTYDLKFRLVATGENRSSNSVLFR